jgi:threonine aldolase
LDRRRFFAISAALATEQANSSADRTALPALEHRAGGGLFTTVDLQSDGLALSPREYSTLLARLADRTSLPPDNSSNGGAVEELEKTFAELLGKPAAIFLPTGTLANHLAVRQWASGRRRVLVPAESHLYNDSGDCAETLSGLNLVPMAPGRATFDLTEVRGWFERSAGGRVATPVGAIVIESPVRRRNHEMFDPTAMEEISAYARDRGIGLHLDGARSLRTAGTSAAPAMLRSSRWRGVLLTRSLGDASRTGRLGPTRVP